MPKKVLVIDDDENIVDELTLVLGGHGYEVMGANDGQGGLEIALRHHPDLIVLDIMMPGKTGWVVFGEVRKNEQLKSVPVILLTSVASLLRGRDGSAPDGREYRNLRDVLRKGIQFMREEGITRPEAFIDKPVDPEELVLKVRELIG